MLDSSQVSDVASRLRSEDFHRPAHQQLFTLIFELVERDRVADYVSIIDEADKRGVVEQLGGISYLLGLPQACPSVANVPIYVERVREHAVRRRL